MAEKNVVGCASAPREPQPSSGIPWQDTYEITHVNGQRVKPSSEASAPQTEKTRCDGRYPVGHQRSEPFDVTYRCALPAGHDGPHGDRSEPIEPHPADRSQPIGEPREPHAALVKELEWCRDNGNHGPRTEKAIIAALAALITKGDQT